MMLVGVIACAGVVVGQAASKKGYSLASADCIEVRGETRDRVQTLMMEALDEAFKLHVEKMFDVWMKDSKGQPDRARTGVRQGLKAYLGARENVLKWNVERIC